MYFYHAHAIALGGRIGSTTLKINQGSCALAVTGGASTADADPANPQFPDIITFKSAYSEVSGEETTQGSGPAKYLTKAHVDLQGLNIKNVVKIGKIVADVVSTYTARDYEASVAVNGSIDNLTIHDQKVDVTISDKFTAQYTTYGSMQVAFQNRFSQPFINCLVGRGLTQALATTNDLKDAYAAYDEQSALSTLKSAVVCSLVQGVGSLPQGATSCGGPCIIKLERLGTLYLGELIVWPWMRCLNMFRMELIGTDGKSVVGSISGASVGSNGTGFPPGYGGYGNGNGG